MYVCKKQIIKLQLSSAVLTDLKCGPFPGPGSASERRVSMNPIYEFIRHDDDHVEDAFSRFKKTHNKDYRDRATHERRKHNFRQNLRSVTLYGYLQLAVVLCCASLQFTLLNQIKFKLLNFKRF